MILNSLPIYYHTNCTMANQNFNPDYNTNFLFDTSMKDILTKYSEDALIVALFAKYPNWKEIIEEKYQMMRKCFEESCKSKLYEIPRGIEITLKYPEIMNEGMKNEVCISKFTAIMSGD